MKEKLTAKAVGRAKSGMHGDGLWLRVTSAERAYQRGGKVREMGFGSFPAVSRGARCDEIELDGAGWTIPAGRMKGGQPHRVPLSSPALAVLREMAARRDSSGLVDSSAACRSPSAIGRPRRPPIPTVSCSRRSLMPSPLPSRRPAGAAISMRSTRC